MALIDKIKEIVINLDLFQRYQTENKMFKIRNHNFNACKQNGRKKLNTQDKIRIQSKRFIVIFAVFNISFPLLLNSTFADCVYHKCYCWIAVQIIIMDLCPNTDSTNSTFSNMVIIILIAR